MFDTEKQRLHMKKIILPLLCLYVLANCTPATAQLVSKSYTSSVMKAFMNGQTYAVLTADAPFNAWFQSALEKQWTVSPLQFITPAQLDSAVISDRNFFLYAVAKDEKTSAIRQLTTDDLSKKREFFFVLSQGGYKQAKMLYAAGTGGSKVLGSFRYGPDRADLTAGMIDNEIMLSLLNQSLKVVMDYKIKSMVKDSVKWTISDENDKQISEKTLLISRACNDGTIALDDKPLVSSKVLSDYVYEYLIVSKDSIQTLFDESSGEYCYLMLYFPTAHFKTLEDCGDIIIYDPFLKKVLYYEDNLDGPWLEKWKLKQLMNAVKSK